MRKPATITLLLAVTLLAAAPPAPGKAPDPVAAVNVADGVALKGYDPVGYFTTGEAMPGSPAHTYAFKGATYRFASAANRARFVAAPEQYLPQYGGYCAYAMSINRIADIDPERWAIVDGKLYLNNNRVAHTLWSVNRAGNIGAADGNWKQYPTVPLTP